MSLHPHKCVLCS